MTVPVVLSLTTIASRSHLVPRVVESLLAQRGDHIAVHLNLPHKVEVDGLPTDARLQVFRVADEGPITKLVPTVRRITDPDTRIIIVDDDFTYHPDMVAVYRAWLDVPAYRDAALGFAGLIYDREASRFGWLSTLPPSQSYAAEYLQGFKSACYKRGHFPVAFTEGWAAAHWADDFTIGAWLGAAGIPAYVISYEHEHDPRPRVLSFPLTHELSHGADGCAGFRDRDGGVAVSDRAFLDGPMGRYATTRHALTR